MTSISWRASLLLLGLLAVIGRPSSAGDRRPIVETDLFQFLWAADPQITPDGSRVAFVRVAVDRDRDDYVSSIWAVPAEGGEPVRLTGGPRDSWPRWSPDGSRLLFLRKSDAEGKVIRPPQVFVLTLKGGEPRPLTDLPGGVSAPAWSPDGRAVAFLAGVSSQAPHKAGPDDRKSDVRIVTRAEFQWDHRGYMDQIAHLWVVGAAEKSHPRCLTSGPFEESDPCWSPDGKKLYFVSDRDPEPHGRPERVALYAVSSGGGPIEAIAAIPGIISAPSPAPDGRSLAFRGTLTEEVRSYTPPDLFVVDLVAKGPPRNLTADCDDDIGGNLSGDQHPPRASSPTRPIWSNSGRSLVDKVAHRGKVNLVSFEAANGQAKPVTTGESDDFAFDGSADGSKIAFLSMTATTLADVFVTDSGGGPPRKLTDLNARLFERMDLCPPEPIRYHSFDGLELAAWVQKPPGFDPSKTYPMILNIHGGPHVAYGATFLHEVQTLASRGYVVLYANPRGSSSYGAEFGNAIQHQYPGDDYKDLMAGVDELIRRGSIDPTRLGITGGSGGGLLTNWAITQTDRFAAAVAERSIADWSTWWYATDVALFRATWFKTPPFQDPAGFAERSPITFVEKVKTPLMLIEADADLRTPAVAGGEAMFRALKALRKPVVMVRFPEEAHDLARSGRPWHRVERLQHRANWFDKYLKDRPMPQYDPIDERPE
ncbi:S9 family peptidase [Tundrisphaera lichenicola]|uniref:S9 family peptidase n=1 Tax=Tundrisphaera lichenicola TaxID=2029860 RepID=UPI003EB97F1D